MTSMEDAYTSQEVDYWKKEIHKLLNREELHRIGSGKVSGPKIQRVPEYMAARVEFGKYYLPTFISIGPTHFAKPYVEQGVPYKFIWTAMYLENTNQNFEDLLNTIERYLGFQELKELFASNCWAEKLPRNVLGPLEDVKMKKMYDLYHLVLTVDGCSILQLLDESVDSDDAEQELKISIDKLVRVHQDLLLLENQIPYKVLKLLCNDEARLNRCMRNFLQIHGIGGAWSRTGKQEFTVGEVLPLPEHNVKVEDQEVDDPVHLLDYLRSALLNRELGQIHKEIKINRKSLHLRKYRIGTIRELKAAGIRVRKDPHNTGFYPSFISGQLKLPEFTVDGSTAFIYLNLIAYEMCPDFYNNLEISSNIVFLSSLIDQPEDVKELRNAGILRNELANDKQVADLFNWMDIVLVPETARFAHIRDQIEAHFESKRGKIKVLGWMGEAYINYFRTPWTIIALLAATLGLSLAFLQTWFTIHPN